MKSHIEEEINSIKEKVLYMGSLAEEMISLSAKILNERNQELCSQVLEREEKINKLQMEIDETGVKILALYQPEATDLRTIMAATKINSELERVADQAVNIAQTSSFHFLKEIPIAPIYEIPKMSSIAQEMVKQSLDAFAKRDVELAKSVLEKDEELDTLKSKVFEDVLDLVKNSPLKAKQFIDLILISRNLEKIGDHATNIAEDVIYMVLGKDIRHHAV
ncbi:MAG: phosphate transport system regulatory protein PhoU [Elusimicrobia bacterium RIFCSPLOWO2_02_FULL_39_32]|nr:MAG: phosphate transport system regulatory protein PhoU [Elusimicrobia bacterium GWA2_38_7]OGR79238.1 MAG: phosphate transport system regulatory protein PhoU [Elusimicrobia bacterium RIFCSPHIGHO2_02_FULL_39_36]OGR93139.1 MAG: phosphate transport system regulatory protein PhoU [Elusimicrobia bacterium RIFCSPLOWO2_02_FULL_39_32]OGR99364.1 MAG: phosphate transport system regulatory protein PhoU [Elusimicrobia bacterium RIFCSPLOWO2_12_FULL_39_28]